MAVVRYQSPGCVLSHLSHVRLFVTQWTITCQAPQPMESSQARIPKWVAMPSSRGYFQPRDWIACPVSPAWQMDSLPLSQWGSPLLYLNSHRYIPNNYLCLLCPIVLQSWLVFLLLNMMFMWLSLTFTAAYIDKKMKIKQGKVKFGSVLVFLLTPNKFVYNHLVFVKIKKFTYLCVLI